MRRHLRCSSSASLILSGCGGSNPYLEASLKPAELQGKDKAWFEKNWGAPEREGPRIVWQGKMDLLSNCRRKIRPAPL